MEYLKETLEDSKKIVIKIGSNVLSDDNGNVNKQVLHNIVEQVNELIDLGKQVILVSSGAGICGVGAINKWSRRGDINYKQALCAIGQVELMMAYKEYFRKYQHRLRHSHFEYYVVYTTTNSGLANKMNGLISSLLVAMVTNRGLLRSHLCFLVTL